MRVQSEEVQRSVSLLGETQAWREATLSFEVPGVVAEILVQEGEIVSEDQALAVLRKTDYELEVELAAARHASATAGLAALEAGTRAEEIEIARAALNQTTRTAEFLLREKQRLEKLFDSSAVEASVLDSAVREYEVAREAQSVAEAKLNLALAGPRKEEIEAARAEAQAMEKGLSLARQRLGKTALSAPFTGVVHRRWLDPGATVGPGVAVLHLVDDRQLDITASLPIGLRSPFRQGDRVAVHTIESGGNAGQAEIISIGRVADPAIRTLRLRARFENDRAVLSVNQTVRISVLVQNGESAIYVPLGALIAGYAEAPVVWVVEPATGTIQSRSVTIVEETGLRAAVKGELAAGELLVVSGQNFVVPGDTVRYEVQPASPSTSPVSDGL